MKSEAILFCFLADIEDCNDIPGSGPEDSGLYWLELDNQTYPVYCEISTSGTKYMVYI